MKKGEEAGVYLKDPDLNAFIECSNTMDDVYSNINNYNPKVIQKQTANYNPKVIQKQTALHRILLSCLGWCS